MEKESVQLYVTAPDGKLAKPSMELKAFAKTRLLQPGESETLVMNVSNYDLASFDESVSAWVADPGRYTVRFGASSEDIRATAAYTLRHAYRDSKDGYRSGVEVADRSTVSNL